MVDRINPDEQTQRGRTTIRVPRKWQVNPVKRDAPVTFPIYIIFPMLLKSKRIMHLFKSPILVRVGKKKLKSAGDTQGFAGSLMHESHREHVYVL